MPKTSKQSKSYRRKKPSLRKAKQVVGKAHKRAAKKNMDTFYLKAKVNATLIPTQGLKVANYFYRHFPLFDSTDPLNVTQIPEFNLYRIQYDKVRVNRVTIKVTPKANVLDQVAAQNDGAVNVSGSGMVYHAIDRDGPAPSNIAAIERYPSMRKTSVLKPFTRSYSITYDKMVWLDCQGIYATTQNDTMQRWGMFGGVTVYAENFLEETTEIFNEPWADVEVSYDCVFQGKTSASLTVGEDGSVTLTPQELFTPLVQSSLGVGTHGGPSGLVNVVDNDGVSGTISDRQDHS